MTDKIRVLVLGSGQMGSGVARTVVEKQELELAGVYCRRSEREGTDAGEAITLGRRLGIKLTSDLDATIEHARPDVAIQATCSTLNEARSEILTLLNSGIPVVSIAEEMAYPACVSPDIAREMDDLSRQRGVALVGTGINPGFVLDLLVIVLTGACQNVRSIRAERVNDLSPYGPTVFKSQGVGLSPAAFEAGLADGSVSGHFGFAQSIHMIAKALGWHIDRVEESREAIISNVRRETGFVTVEPGEVAGCLHTARAYIDDKPVITLIHPQQVRPELEGVETRDSIEIDGDPPIHLTTKPEIPGGAATIALAVNMIPRVLAAPPGLHTMADLPAPAAMMGGTLDD